MQPSLPLRSAKLMVLCRLCRQWHPFSAVCGRSSHIDRATLKQMTTRRCWQAKLSNSGAVRDEVSLQYAGGCLLAFNRLVVLVMLCC